MTLVVFYVLVVGSFFIAREGLRGGALSRRIALFVIGAAILVASSLHFGRDLRRASDILRYGLSTVALIAAVDLVSGRRPVHCALALLVVFLCLAGIFVSFQAEFLAAITISINAGAVVVTFLFIVMLIDLRLDVAGESTSQRSLAALVLSTVFAALVIVGFGASGAQPVDRPPPAWFRLAGAAYGADVQNTRLKGPPPEGGERGADWLDTLPEGERAHIDSGRPYDLRPISGYTTHLGWELYTKYTVPFEVASLILTVAVVGAVALGRQGREGEARGAT